MVARSPDPNWPKAGASIAVFRGGQVLVVERAKPPLAGVWSLPGGHIEPGEPAARAALRELAEETGVVAEIAGVAGTREIIRHDASGRIEAHYLIIAHAGLWRSGEPRAQSDVSDVRFVLPEELVHYRVTDGLVEIIARARSLIAERSLP